MRQRRLLLLAVVSIISLGARAELVVYEDTDRLSVVDVPSSFGPHIGEEGLKGHLVASSPDLFGCQPIVINTTSSLATFVLIERSPPGSSAGDATHCSFEHKVRNAQAAGASLAVIFDSSSGPLVRMKADKPDGIHIPSVFINQRSGVALLELIVRTPSGPLSFIDNGDPYPSVFDSLNLTMLGLIVGFLLIVLVCGTLFLCSTSRFRRPPPPKSETLPMEDVLALPEVLVTPESDYKGQTCPVCLEEYDAGERLKVLPCKHAFHTDCIAPWLCERQRTCPLCKESVVPTAADPLLHDGMPTPATTPATSTIGPDPEQDEACEEDNNQLGSVVVRGGEEEEGKQEPPLVVQVVTPPAAEEASRA